LFDVQASQARCLLISGTRETLAPAEDFVLLKL
jgi:hypothetical protein